MYLRLEYMREKLKEWRPHWDIKTINSWPPKQLYAIYRKVQRQELDRISRGFEQLRLF